MVQKKGVVLQFIQPGRPRQNPYVKRFNKTYREEILSRYLFFDLKEVRELTRSWIEDYNNFRPRDSLGNFTPIEYVSRHGALTVDNFSEVTHTGLWLFTR